MLTTSSEPWQDNCQRLAVHITIWLCSILSINLGSYQSPKRLSWTTCCLSLGTPAPKVRGSRGCTPWQGISSMLYIERTEHATVQCIPYHEKKKLRGPWKVWNDATRFWLPLYATSNSSKLALARKAYEDLRLSQTLTTRVTASSLAVWKVTVMQTTGSSTPSPSRTTPKPVLFHLVLLKDWWSKIRIKSHTFESLTIYEVIPLCSIEGAEYGSWAGWVALVSPVSLIST